MNAMAVIGIRCSYFMKVTRYEIQIIIVIHFHNGFPEYMFEQKCVYPYEYDANDCGITSDWKYIFILRQNDQNGSYYSDGSLR